MLFRIAIDAGGTFTDGVLVNETGETIMTKSRTTPQDLSIGTMDCINKLAKEAGISLRDLLSL